MSFFRLVCAALLVGFILLGLAHRQAGHGPDPGAQAIAQLRNAGHTIGPPAKLLWGVPSVTVSMEGCSNPVKLVMFDFDEIAAAGIMRAAQMAEHDTYRIDYAGQRFDSFDRAALYRLRLRNDIAQLVKTLDLTEPPVFLTFWPPGCPPRQLF